MKAPIALLGLVSFATLSFAQGRVNFVNTSSTLISVDGAAMPPSGTKQFIFAVFLAPSTTVTAPGQIVTYDDPRFQLVAAYNTNRSTSNGLLVNRAAVDVTSTGGNPHAFGPGSTVDFVVRGWSVNAGATWGEALTNYNNGFTVVFPMQIGSSVVGNDLVLGGGAIPAANLFGSWPWQVGGFSVNVVTIPWSPPFITKQPQPLNQTVEAGATVRFAVEAGFEYLSYRWRLNGNFITAASTNHVLELKNIGAAQSGFYTVVVANLGGAVTSAPVTLSVISPVVRRFAPGIVISAQPSFVTVEYTSSLSVSSDWTAFPAVFLHPNQPPYFVDATSPLPSRRFYRASSTNVAPSLALQMVPALTLTGNPGDLVRVDGIKATEPVGDWFTLSTVTLTNTSQPYFDVTAPGQPARLYRFVRLP